MASASAQSLRRGGPLPRLWIDSSLTSYRSSLRSPTSALSSAQASGVTTVSDTPFDADVFHVICLYDFDAEDFDQLSFRKNEILDVIKQEETGWWAAMRPGNKQVGWIPSAFVEPISEGQQSRLHAATEASRVYEDNTGRLYVPTINHPQIVSPDTQFRGFDWMPMLDGEQAHVGGFPSLDGKGGSPSVFSPLVPPHEGIDGFAQDLEIFSPIGEAVSSYPQPPPSPLTQMPQPPRKTLLSPATSPQTPQRPFSSPVGASEPNTPGLSRSRSEPTGIPTNRHVRRRPLLIDDRSSLNRLSTLFESNNVEELEVLISSPVVADSFNAFTRTNGSPAKRGNAPEEMNGTISAHSPRSGRSPQRNTESAKMRHMPRSAGVEDEIQMLPDGGIGAGTLQALLEQLIADGPESIPIMKFRRVFLTTFKTFASADEMFIFLLSRYHVGSSTIPTAKELAMQNRILTILSMWSSEYGMLQDDPHLGQRLVRFLSLIRAPSPLAGLAQAMRRTLDHSTSIAPSAIVPPRKRKKSKSFKADLLRMDPTLFAEQLCLYEHGLYTKIRPPECLRWPKTRTGDSVTNLLAFHATHDRLVAWIQTSILTREVIAKQCEALRFWITVAEKCTMLNNFSTLSAIVAALSDHARLHEIWGHVPLRSHFESLARLVEPPGNYSAYRHHHMSIHGPCIPLVEMHLSDIVRIAVQYTDYTLVPVSSTDSCMSLINFAKREKWYDAMDALLRHQAAVYTFTEDTNVMGFIEASLAAADCAREKEHVPFWLKDVQQPERDVADIRMALEATSF
ncbi:ras GEF [Amylocystis lapponica]|nr:ras GEF [Amylocystis lapponica]